MIRMWSDLQLVIILVAALVLWLWPHPDTLRGPKPREGWGAKQVLRRSMVISQSKRGCFTPSWGIISLVVFAVGSNGLLPVGIIKKKKEKNSWLLAPTTCVQLCRPYKTTPFFLSQISNPSQHDNNWPEEIIDNILFERSRERERTKFDHGCWQR